MADKPKARPGFAKWVDAATGAADSGLPLTHVTKGLRAQDVIHAGRIEPTDCAVFRSPLAYFFYGRPAYRYEAGSSVKLESACPFCFIFDPKLLRRARHIYPFDTGAFSARMYNHVLDDDFNIEDFDLGSEPDRPEKLISAAYLSRADYASGNKSGLLPIDTAAKAYDMEAKAYMSLLHSQGRNEPDDRIGTIEVQFGDPVPLAENLMALVIPHTFWINGDRSPLIEGLEKNGADILTYEFIPGRPITHYHTLLEVTVRDYLRHKKFIP